MGRSAARSRPPTQAEDLALLDALLANHVPSRRTLLRPARLRELPEEEPGRAGPLRTWVDHALHVAERALTIAALAAFGYWLADGYGRDWLHALRGSPPPAVAAPAPTIAPAIAPPLTAPAAAAPELPALPFVDEAGAAPRETDSFLAPQPLLQMPAASDPRPQRLAIPSIGVDTPVIEVFVQEGAWQVAEYAAGYHHGSALPGSSGNVVMAGHAGLRGAVFRDLGRLAAGDQIIVETGGWRYTYSVRSLLNVWPTQVEVMDPTDTAVLTLITCTNWDTQRLVVVADLIGAHPLG